MESNAYKKQQADCKTTPTDTVLQLEIVATSTLIAFLDLISINKLSFINSMTNAHMTQ